MILKKLLKKISPYVMFGTAWIVILAVLLLGERISGPLASALYAVGGILLGFGAVEIALSRIQMSPEQRKEYERGEHDERNLAIREKAAMDSWYWTLYLLWAAFMVIQIFVGGLWGVAVSAAIVLHCTFYMVNLHRWNKRM